MKTMKNYGLQVSQLIQLKTTIPPGRHSLCRSRWWRDFLLVWLVLLPFVLSPTAKAQLPNTFVADDPSGSVNSGGANIAYLQNTTASNVTLTLDGNTITTKANRLNIFDRSSGTWVLKAVLNQQSRPISPSPTPTPTGNTFLTGLYSYYKLDEASGDAVDSYGGRNLANYGNPVGSTTGIIGTCRDFPGTSAAYFHASSGATFSPGSQHLFFSFWFRLNNLTQTGNDTGLLVKYLTSSDHEWIVYYSSSDQTLRFDVSSTGAAGTEIVHSVTLAANTWYYVAGGWDGTNIKLSVNGGAYQSTAFTGPIYQSTANNFTIGLELGSAGYLSGRIDEVAIWIGRNDLTISEVQQLYNNGAGLPLSSFQ
jgi:hypothetical protein